MNTSYKAITESYAQYLQTLGFAASTCYNYPRFVAQFLKYAEQKNNCSIDHITTKTIWNYYTHLEQEKGKRTKRSFGTSYLNGVSKSIDTFLEFLHQYGMENAPVPLNYRVETNRIHPIKIFTQEEIKTLRDSITNTYSNLSFEERQAKQYELRLILALFYGCGLRCAEGYRLQIQDVDFDRKTVFVKQGKYSKDRIVPMSAGVYKELQDYLYNFRHRLKLNHNRLFIHGKQALRIKLKQLQNACEDENIKAKRLYPHILRHSIATHLLQNGMAVENISRFLGHNGLESTQIYTHILTENSDEL